MIKEHEPDLLIDLVDLRFDGTYQLGQHESASPGESSEQLLDMGSSDLILVDMLAADLGMATSHEDRMQLVLVLGLDADQIVAHADQLTFRLLILGRDRYGGKFVKRELQAQLSQFLRILPISLAYRIENDA